jgi:gamma-glutamyltranspeptidase
MATIQRNHRPLVMGRHGVVGANHPLVVQAGLDMLRAGGNAADAAVTIALALGVGEPDKSGLGGDGFYHFYDVRTGISTVFNGSGPAPASARPQRLTGALPGTGPLWVSVPGLLGGLAKLHAARGVLKWKSLVSPAIVMAREGVAVTRNLANSIRNGRARLSADVRSSETFLGKTLGDLILRSDLAETLEEIAADGPESFYRGRLARRLVKGFAAAGVPITEADLAAYEAEVAPALVSRYRGYEIRQTPPNSIGFTMQQILRIVEHFDIAALTPAQRVHVLVEAKKHAFIDRDRYSTDPRFGDVPLERLLSDGHTAEQAARIDLARAGHMPIRTESGGDTTYFCVIDGWGNAVSGIQSNASGFGSGLTAGDTGILLNNRMAYWDMIHGHPNLVAPGKRISHTMNAPIVLRENSLWCVLGTPGGDNQVQVNAQALTAMIDLGLDPQTTVERPRWTSSQPGQGADWLQEGHGRLTIEVDHGSEVLEELTRLGHDVQPVPHLGGPGALQIIRVLPNGVRAAGSDPRRDGWAAAY